MDLGNNFRAEFSEFQGTSMVELIHGDKLLFSGGDMRHTRPNNNWDCGDMTDEEAAVVKKFMREHYQREWEAL